MAKPRFTMTFDSEFATMIDAYKDERRIHRNDAIMELCLIVLVGEQSAGVNLSAIRAAAAKIKRAHTMRSQQPRT